MYLSAVKNYRVFDRTFRPFWLELLCSNLFLNGCWKPYQRCLF
ncbi:hypothetical protein HMPREF1118_1234 [Haemophilus parainfluenzae HK262]|nr:hypothetical protein HMPREF1118_1234 [Haemophilus parainfluenzae HK262]